MIILGLILDYIIVPIAGDIVLAILLCTAVYIANAFYSKAHGSQMRLPGTLLLESEELLQPTVSSPSATDSGVVFYKGDDCIRMISSVGWFAASDQLNPNAPEFYPRNLQQNDEEPEEFGPWATEADRDVSSDGVSDDINAYAEIHRSRVEGQTNPAIADAIKNGIQNVLNRRAARGTNKPAPPPQVSATGRRLPQFQLHAADLRHLPTHLDPRFRDVKDYASNWQPHGRPPSDVSPSKFFKPIPEGPVDAWVGDQLHKQPMEFYVDPDCRASTPGTVADGIIDTYSTIRPEQSEQGFEDEDEEVCTWPALSPDRNNESGQDFPYNNEPEQMPVVPVPLGEYIELKEIAEKAKKEAATFKERIEAEFKRLREEMARTFEEPSSHNGQLSDQEPEQRNRPTQTRPRDLPIILSPSLGPQIPSNLLGKSILRRDEKIPTTDTTKPKTRQEKKIDLLRRVLERDAATTGALRDLGIDALAYGAETGNWSYLSPYQGKVLFSTMLQVAADERQASIEFAEQVGRATAKVIKYNKQPDEKVTAEKEFFQNIFESRFNDFWDEIHPNLTFDKDPLALHGHRQYPRFYPATGQMPPQPPHGHVKPEFPGIRDELEMILRKMRRFSRQYFSGTGVDELSPQLYQCLLVMCGGSRDVLNALLQRKDTKHLLVSGFIKRILFSICLGSGWIWQGYDDNLSGLFSLEHTLFTDPAYKYQRTVALTWRAHRFTQLTYQPWWDRMLDTRIKMVADELFKLLGPMQGEDRSKNGFRPVDLFVDLLEMVEGFTKLSAKMYQVEALWSFHFPGNGELFNGARMVWDDASLNHVVAIVGSE
ncbi:hypothetical protein TWF506_011130 [Arthrobotrys conoides]|uniref:Uncharacterized protein n=1 Tax=Arthrobotrys conoides TaxID=74498 RepID=A0AAN8NA39_9PEZI